MDVIKQKRTQHTSMFPDDILKQFQSESLIDSSYLFSLPTFISFRNEECFKKAIDADLFQLVTGALEQKRKRETVQNGRICLKTEVLDDQVAVSVVIDSNLTQEVDTCTRVESSEEKNPIEPEISETHESVPNEKSLVPIVVDQPPFDNVTVSPPIDQSHFQLDLYLPVQLDKRFLVQTRWKSVVEIVHKKESASMIRKLSDSSFSQIEIDPQPKEKIFSLWGSLRIRDFIVFELFPGEGETSFHWYNSVDKSPLTNDRIMFRTLFEYVDSASRCVRCIVPRDVASFVQDMYITWVPNKPSSPDDLLKYKIPLSRSEDHLLCVMILVNSSKTDSDSKSRPPNVDKLLPKKRKSEMSPSCSQTSHQDESAKKQKRLIDPRLEKHRETLESGPSSQETSSSQSVEGRKKSGAWIYPKLDSLLDSAVKGNKQLDNELLKLFAVNINRLTDEEKTKLREKYGGYLELLLTSSETHTVIPTEKTEQATESEIEMPAPIFRSSPLIPDDESNPNLNSQDVVQMVSQDDSSEIVDSGHIFDPSSLASEIPTEVDLLIESLKDAPSDKSIRVRVPNSAYGDPLEIIKLLDFVNERKHLRLSFDNPNWALPKSYFEQVVADRPGWHDKGNESDSESAEENVDNDSGSCGTKRRSRSRSSDEEPSPRPRSQSSTDQVEKQGFGIKFRGWRFESQFRRFY